MSPKNNELLNIPVRKLWPEAGYTSWLPALTVKNINPYIRAGYSSINIDLPGCLNFFILNDPNHKDKKYHELAEKFLNGSITPGEEKELSDWYNNDLDNAVDVPASFAKNEAELKSRMWAGIRSGMYGDKKGRNYRSLYVKLALAATVMLAIAGGWLYYYNAPAPGIMLSAKDEAPTGILPVTVAANRVSIILDDGTVYYPEEMRDGLVTQLGKTKVIKLKTGELSYKALEGSGGQQPAYSTVKTPAGFQYEIILPDNSKVWLNATSSLRFPTAFTGHERRVQLKGEGYFEIEKNKAMPFIVDVNGMEVSVLGTHFNVMAYEDESEIKTTLLEGAVSVNKDGKKTMIKPGEQAKVTKNDAVVKVTSNVNLEAVMAWKNGEFHFENASVQTIISQIGRWYDVSVTYKGNVRSPGFTGIIARTKNISQILEILEAAQCFHYDLKGNRVVISPFNTP